MKEIKIDTEFIKLSQLLKLSGSIDQGSDARTYINDEMILLNGKTVTERGKKIRPGDIIEIKGIEKIKVLSK